MEFFHIAIELIVGYIALLIMTKILGKTQITQISTFDFISALVLGELVGNALYDGKIGLEKILFSIVVWGILIYTTEMITQKSRKLRGMLEGEPSIIIRKGQIQYDQLKKNKLDINQLQHLLRSKNVFSIRECDYAILETDGTINALKKSEYSSPTIKDMNLPLKPVYLPVTLILDGEVVLKNLRKIQWDKDKLEQEIQLYGAQSIKEVLYAEWKEGEALHVQTY